MRTWQEAMHAALYGDGGFYRASGAPGRHFRTAVHASGQWAAALLRLCARVDADLGHPPDFTVVDMGAGGGELVAAMAGTAPDRWQLLGVEVADRPASLPSRVGWQAELPVAFDGVLIAVEWLDVVPVHVVELTETGPRLVEVDVAGHERLGGAPEAADGAWLEQWWPLREVGERAEVGRPRDEAWSEARRRVRRGAAVAVDYAAVPERDVAGTLAGFRDGRQVLPVPDGSMDLTAHVLFDSLVTGGAGGWQTWLVAQREALPALGLAAPAAVYDADPAAYLAALSQRGELAELLDPSGLGGFTWLVQATADVPSPLRLPGGGSDAP